MLHCSSVTSVARQFGSCTDWTKYLYLLLHFC